MGALEQAFGAATNEAVVEAVPASDLDLDSDEIPSLGSQDLQPVVTEALRREVTRDIVAGLKGSPVGTLIDGATLAYRLDQHFADLCDGRSFDFRPVLEGLRQMPGFTDRLAYVGLVRIRRKLEEHGLELKLPDLDVPEGEREKLLAEAEEVERRERAQRRKSSSSREEEERPAGPKSPSNTLEVPAPQGGRREQRLRRYGLLGLGSRRWRVIRIGVLSVLLLGTGVTAWLMRPHRSLDPQRFPLPLSQAEVHHGAFSGRLVDARWYGLTPAQREAAVEKMNDALRAAGVAGRALIFDERGRLVMRGAGKGGLEASRFALESPDGVTPPPPGPARDPAEAAAAEGEPP
jgi:hypothetical protein